MREGSKAGGWITRGVVGIVLATFFSDVGHELVTAILPFYLAEVGLGAAALGAMEGLADLVYSLSKLGGGVLGHRVEKKRPLTAFGYLLTAVGMGAIALVQSVAALVSLRAVAWLGRGLRGPLRDHLLADEVEESHYGRAYGLERSADMLGAMVGPLVAVLLVWLGLHYRSIVLVAFVPSMLPVLSILLLTRDRVSAEPGHMATAPRARMSLPRVFWIYLGGVLLFGLGDFSRTFLVFLAAKELGASGGGAPGTLSIPVLLYVMHSTVSAVVAYPVGRLADRTSKLPILVGGYALGALTNLLLATGASSVPILVLAIALSGVYIAIEETVEKAVAAERLPRELRSLGFGVLAAANAVGDLGSSLFVGLALEAGDRTLAFGVPAALGAAGALWMAFLARREWRYSPKR